MKNMIAAGARIDDLKASVKSGPLKGKVKICPRHYARLTNQAAYLDLEDIHTEIAAKRPLSWEDIDSQFAPL